MDYSKILRLLAQKKIEKDQQIAQNTEAQREPAAINVLPISGQDTQKIQDLNILDKINMKKQGLDPWNTDDIDKYRSGQGS
jgi:hypothetical protein